MTGRNAVYDAPCSLVLAVAEIGNEGISLCFVTGGFETESCCMKT